MTDSVCHVTLQTEILSTETLDYLKQMTFLKSFNSVLNKSYFSAQGQVTLK